MGKYPRQGKKHEVCRESFVIWLRKQVLDLFSSFSIHFVMEDVETTAPLSAQKVSKSPQLQTPKPSFWRRQDLSNAVSFHISRVSVLIGLFFSEIATSSGLLGLGFVVEFCMRIHSDIKVNECAIGETLSIQLCLRLHILSLTYYAIGIAKSLAIASSSPAYS